MSSGLTIPPFATLARDILPMLVEHGPEALLAASGIETCARSLLESPRTICPADRSSYGDADTWAAWDALRAEHGQRLREIAEEYTARSMAENDRRVAASILYEPDRCPVED